MLEIVDCKNLGHSYIVNASNGSLQCARCNTVVATPDTFHTGEEIVNLWNSGQFGSGAATLQADGSALISGQGTAANNDALTSSILQASPNFQPYVAVVYKTNTTTTARWCTYNDPASYDFTMNATSNWTVAAFAANEGIHSRVDVRWNITASANTQIAYIATFSNHADWVAFVNNSASYTIPTNVG